VSIKGEELSSTRKSKIGQRTANFVDPITIGFDRLQILIQEFAERVYDRLFWVTPLAVAITLVATLVVSDFQDRYGLKAEDWRDGTICLLIAFIVWTVFAVVKTCGHQNISDLMDGIASEAHSPVRNYALTYFRAQDDSGTSLVLVYFDSIWQCYLMPFVSLQPGQSDPLDVSEYASQRFSLPKEAFAADELVGHEVRHTKTSEASHKMTNYRFTFYLMKVATKHRGLFLEREFEVQERKYRWLTIEQLLSDAVSMNRNGEIFSYMRDKPSGFFADSVPRSVDVAIGN
jgi:hypothetical protein